MNALKRLFAVMLVGGAGFGLFVACGNNTSEVECDFDSECLDGEACESNVCIPTCTTDDECGAGEVCEPGVNTPLNICQAGSDTNNNNNNNNNNNANSGNTLLYVAQIRSATPAGAGADLCGTDPGPDIFAVALEDAQNNVLGWGSVVWEEIQGDGNDQADSSMLDGSAPSLNAEACPEGEFADSVASIGCGTQYYINVEFLDSASQVVALDATANQVIRVFEYGNQCSTAGINDEYDIYLCADTAAAKSGDVASCNIMLTGGATGEATGNVSGF